MIMALRMMYRVMSSYVFFVCTYCKRVILLYLLDSIEGELCNFCPRVEVIVGTNERKTKLRRATKPHTIFVLSSFF